MISLSRGCGGVRISLTLPSLLGVPDQMNLERPKRVEVNVALGKGDVDSRLPEFAVNGQVQLVRHGEAIIDPPHESAELEIEAVVTKAEEKGRGLRLTQHNQVFPGDLEKQLLCHLGVGPVGDTHRDDDSSDRI